MHNLQGDIVSIIDSTGTEVVKYTYDAWGKVLSTTGSLASTLGTVQPFRYREYVYDVETGLYYLRSRYYNPEWGRFINADDRITSNKYGTNNYCYCANNPCMYVDKNGHNWFVDTFNNAKQALCSAWDKANEIGIAVGDFCVQAAIDISDTCVEAANEICKFAIKSVDSLVSIIHGLSVEVGLGMGVGGEFEIGLASFGATFRHDYLNINGNVIDGLDIGSVTEYSMGASVGVGDLSYGMNMTATHSHSYFDNNCSCKNKLNHSYSCPVDNYSFSTEKSISFGFSGYIGIGGTLQITYYSDQVANDLYNIWK